MGFHIKKAVKRVILTWEKLVKDREIIIRLGMAVFSRQRLLVRTVPVYLCGHGYAQMIDQQTFLPIVFARKWRKYLPYGNSV